MRSLFFSYKTSVHSAGYSGKTHYSIILPLSAIDPSKKMDANVLNCSASSVGGKREQLIDQFGCVKRPDLMTFFDKSRTSNGVQADLMLYSYIKVCELITI